MSLWLLMKSRQLIMAARTDTTARPTRIRLPVRTLLAVTLLSLFLALSVTSALTMLSAARAADQYSATHRALLSDVAVARAAGYPDSDLAQVTADLRALETSEAPVGTPVIVYPGNGTPVADQLKQSTVDDNGQPTTGPKGA